MITEKQLLALILQKKVTLSFLMDSKWHIVMNENELRPYFMKNPIGAFFYAYVIEGTSEETREISSRDPMWSFLYALKLDKHETETTKQGCKGTKYEHLYEETIPPYEAIEGFDVDLYLPANGNIMLYMDALMTYLDIDQVLL